MKLNLRQKQSFYHELEQFLRSGIPLPQAVEALLPDVGRGAVRQALERLLVFFRAGATVPDAFSQLRPAIGDMEAELIGASSTSGRLEHAMAYLSDYFGTLESVRANLIKQTAWPIIQLHLGVFLLSLSDLILTGNMIAYLRTCFGFLGIVYLTAFVIGAAAVMLLRLARVEPAADIFLRRIPLLGKLRRNLTTSRFCATYEMQLQAGINIMDSLRASARASQSALIDRAIGAVLPEIRRGHSLGPLLTNSTALPAPLIRAIRLGEETGSLDEDLRKWANYYRDAALRNLETLGTWLPRIISTVVLLYLGYRIVIAGAQTLHGYDQFLN